MKILKTRHFPKALKAPTVIFLLAPEPQIYSTTMDLEINSCWVSQRHCKQSSPQLVSPSTHPTHTHTYTCHQPPQLALCIPSISWSPSSKLLQSTLATPPAPHGSPSDPLDHLHQDHWPPGLPSGVTSLLCPMWPLSYQGQRPASHTHTKPEVVAGTRHCLSGP